MIIRKYEYYVFYGSGYRMEQYKTADNLEMAQRLNFLLAQTNDFTMIYHNSKGETNAEVLTRYLGVGAIPGDERPDGK